MILDNALTKLAIKHPFLSAAALRMKLVVNNDIPTCGTDGKQMIYNEEWMATLPLNHQVFLLAHESMHSILKHCVMIRKWHDSGYGPDSEPFDPQIMNRAMDFLINGSLIDEGFEMPPHPSGGEGCYKKGIDLEYDLVKLYKELKNQAGQKGASAPNFQPIDDHNQAPPPQGDGGGDDGDDDIVSASNLVAAAKAHGMQTHSPSKLVNNILKIMAPVTESPWAMLRDLVNRTSGRDMTSWQRPNRHLIARGIIAPGMVGSKSPPLAVVLDTSGSCYEYISTFVNHLGAIANDAQPESILLVFVDDKVQSHIEYNSVADFLAEAPNIIVPHGGCTDMRQGVTFCEQRGFSRCVILTDGETPYPSASSMHLIWAITTSIVSPIGDTVHIPPEK